MNAIHGYQIAWALLVQWAAEERSDDDILDLMAFYREIGLPASLPELGMDDPTESEIDQMAEWTMVAPHLANLDRPVDPAMLAAAIWRVEMLASKGVRISDTRSIVRHCWEARPDNRRIQRAWQAFRAVSGVSRCVRCFGCPPRRGA